MEVRANYQLLSKATISSISYNPQYDLLALIADGNDTVTFFSLSSSHLQFTPRLTNESRPPSQGCVRWSPNGRLIAVANTKVEIWKFDGSKMAPLMVIPEGYIQIKNLAWSQDNQRYLCYGVNPRDTPLSINIRNLETSQLRQILTEDTVAMANFDPFGKYIVVLTLNNSLWLYDACSLDKVRTINLAESKNDLVTKGDRRLADWSPEFSYFVCPNLNDCRIPTAIIFDRNRQFSTKEILLGHQATISCCKFNPNIYEHQSDVTFILAIGDSSGCISFWRVGKHKRYEEPLFIVSSPAKAEQSIQQLQWNNQGNVLLVNALKKYVVVLGFSDGSFGKKMTEPAKNNLIVATYGASGANQIAGAQLEVFGKTQYDFKDIKEKEQQKYIIDTKFQVKQKPKQALVKTAQQVIYSKDPNNKQKKRIIPSRYVPESELALRESNAVSNGNGMTEKPRMPILKIPPLKAETKRQYLLPNQHVLLVQHSKDMYILTIKTKLVRPVGEEQDSRFFTSQIKLITITRQHVLLVNNEKLFIFDLDLKPVELPCYLGEVSNFSANNEGAVFYMNTNGLIRGFNFFKHQFILETSAAYLFMSEQDTEITSNPFSMFVVFDSDSERLHVELKSNLSRYFYSKESNTWLEFQFEEGFYVPGHSLRLTPIEKHDADNFYAKLVAPAILASQTNKKDSSVNQFELQLLYYGKYVKSREKFNDVLVKMLLDLKLRGNSTELRREITKYFVDRNSPDYLNDGELWEKVKKIGGKVIEEFELLGHRE